MDNKVIVDDLIRMNAKNARLPLRMTPYVRVVDGNPSGTSLLKAFNGKSKDIHARLGVADNQEQSKSLYPDGKYTFDYMVEYGAGSGEFYTIYTCYREWRVGGVKGYCHHLGELIEYLSPCACKGWSDIPVDILLLHPLEANMIATKKELAAWRALEG